MSTKYNKPKRNYNNNNVDPNKPRPNYFLGLKIDNDVNLKLDTITNQLKIKHNHIKHQFITKEKYHLSLIILTLENEEKLNLVKSLLSSIKELHNKHYIEQGLKTQASVSGIGSFKDRVLWAGLKDDQDKTNLIKFVNEIREIFKSQSIEIDDREWSPHITLAKGNLIKPTINDPLTLASVNQEFGLQEFIQMDLMKIGSTNKLNGYYEIIETVNFN